MFTINCLQANISSIIALGNEVIFIIIENYVDQYLIWIKTK